MATVVIVDDKRGESVVSKLSVERGAVILGAVVVPCIEVDTPRLSVQAIRSIDNITNVKIKNSLFILIYPTYVVFAFPNFNMRFFFCQC